MKKIKPLIFYLIIAQVISLCSLVERGHAQQVGDCWDVRIQGHTTCEDYNPSSDSGYSDSEALGMGLPGLILFGLGLHPVQIQRAAEQTEITRNNNLNLAYNENKKCVERSSHSGIEAYRNALPYCQNAASICKRNGGGERCHTYEANLHYIKAWIEYKDENYQEAIREYKAIMPLCKTQEECNHLNKNVANIKATIEYNLLQKKNEKNLSSAHDRLDQLTQNTKTTDVPDSLDFIDPRKKEENKKTNKLLDALTAGNKSWKDSVKYLEKELRKNPHDRATRDALAYVKGLYEGHLRLSQLNDTRYKKGVYEWMDGNYADAAANFSAAYQAHPDDKGALAAFAFTSGLHDGTRATRWLECSMIGTCDEEIDPPTLEYTTVSSIYALLNNEERQKLEKLRAEVMRNPDNLQQRAALNFVDGIAAWDDYKKRKDETVQAALSDSLQKIDAKNYKAAVSTLVSSRGQDLDNEAITYAYYHARGLEEGDRYQDSSSSGPEPVWNERMTKAYTELLREDLMTLPTDQAWPWEQVGRKVDHKQEKAWDRFTQDIFK